MDPMTPQVTQRLLRTLEETFQTYMLAEDARREAVYRHNLVIPNPNDHQYATALKRFGQSFAKAQTATELITGIEMARGEFVHAECIALLALVERDLFLLNRQILLAGARENRSPELSDALRALKQAHNEARRRWLHAQESFERGLVDESRRHIRTAYALVAQASKAYFKSAEGMDQSIADHIRHELERIRSGQVAGSRESRAFFWWQVGLGILLTIAGIVLGKYFV